MLLLLLFLTFSVLVANPKKLLYTVANPARGLLNREKRTKEKVWQHTPPPHPPHCSFGESNVRVKLSIGHVFFMFVLMDLLTVRHKYWKSCTI